MNKFDRSLVITIVLSLLIYVLFCFWITDKIANTTITTEEEKIEYVVKIATNNHTHENTQIVHESDENIKANFITITAKITAYAPFDNQSGICADENPNVTSIGHIPSAQYVAISPDKIPYGTKMYIPNYGFVEAGDTGGALRLYDGYAIDVFFNTYKEAIEWGKQYLKVKIYK